MAAQRIYMHQKQWRAMTRGSIWQLVPSPTKALLTFIFIITTTLLILILIISISKWENDIINQPFFSKRTPTPNLREVTVEPNSSFLVQGGEYLIATAMVYVRSGPGDNFASIALFESGKQAQIIGMSTDKQWLAVELPYLTSGIGWIRLNQVTTSSLDNVPVLKDNLAFQITSTPSENSASLTAIANVNVREGPGLNYDIVGLLNKDERSEILGKDTNNYWWAIRNPSEPDSIGWVSVDYVLARNTTQVEVILPEDMKGISVISTPSPDNPSLSAIVMVNIRKGPGINFEIIAKLEQDQIAEVIGLSQDGMWYAIKVQLEGIDIGWVNANYVEVDKSISLPILH